MSVRATQTVGMAGVGPFVLTRSMVMVGCGLFIPPSFVPQVTEIKTQGYRYRDTSTALDIATQHFTARNTE